MAFMSYGLKSCFLTFLPDSVTSLDGGDESVRQLYQMDRGKSPGKQFIGGHGFTDLIYVYHASSAAELQHFCEAH
ncbi:hypothetical protein ACFLSG_00550 [Candidatus Bipolaricaulota bacterium]